MAETMKEIQKNVMKRMNDNSLIGNTQIPSSNQDIKHLYFNNKMSTMNSKPLPKHLWTSHVTCVLVKDSFKLLFMTKIKFQYVSTNKISENCHNLSTTSFVPILIHKRK